MDALYRPRFGRTYDDAKGTDALGERLLEEPGEYIPRTPQVKVEVPTPCSLSYWCSRQNFHLGACDNLERLELVTVWDGETGEMMLCDDDVEQEPPFWVVPKRRRARRTGT